MAQLSSPRLRHYRFYSNSERFHFLSFLRNAVLHSLYIIYIYLSFYHTHVYILYGSMYLYYNTILCIYTQLFTPMYTCHVSISMKETGTGIRRLYTEAKHCVLRSLSQSYGSVPSACVLRTYVCTWYTNHNMFAALAWKRFEVFLLLMHGLTDDNGKHLHVLTDVRIMTITCCRNLCSRTLVSNLNA